MNKDQTITRDNLKAIYDIACSSWKSKLDGYAKRNPFESEISLTQSEIDEMFKASDTSQIGVLKKFFSVPLDIRDKVKSFIDACIILNIDHKSVFSLTDTKGEAAFKRLKVIIRALNEGWWPDWNNQNEYKYWIWWTMKGGFSYSRVRYHDTFTLVPSALCLRTEELAKHASKIAFDDYELYYTDKY